jgi:UDP-N-acetylmuramyl tripeptide synthase
MTRPAAGKLALARAVGALTRLAGGGGTSAPGKALLALDRGALAALGARLRDGSVLVSATNGKTTTSAMLASMLERGGARLVHNRSGANMDGGIASALLAAARPGGAIAGELGLFEVDEMWLPAMVQELAPRVVLLGNLFRDQLDRYGELESIAARWSQTLASGRGAAAQLVLCADDPLVADLGAGRPDAGEGRRTVYFGIEDRAAALPEMGHAADARHCVRCGAPYRFEAVYLAHLGRYRCPSCDHVRPAPQVCASDIALQGTRAVTFTLRMPAGEARVRLGLPGVYNVYNALGAAAAAGALGLDVELIAAALADMRPAFGRAETVWLAGRELRILLVKNPVGASEVLRTLASEPGELDILGVLNDGIADGRDVSWIWDADFELLAGRVRHATCAGSRAAELAARLKYAGVEPARIALVPELRAALAHALAQREDAAAPPGGEAPTRSREQLERSFSPLYALPTYTAMLSLRKLIGAGGRSLGRAA